MKRYFTATVILLLFTLACPAVELQLSPVFGNNMVLQRSTAVPVWGSAEAGESISIRFADQLMQTTADENGNWKALLNPLAASAKPSRLTVKSSSGRSVHCDDLLVGDVWLCSGQSNMYMPVNNIDNSAQAIARANHSEIRLLKMNYKRAKKTFSMGTWQKCSPDSVKDFSAVAYYFGRKINRDLNVPVGLIQSSVGGTQVERWIPKQDADTSLEYLSAIGDLYDGMILPFTDFAVRGFLWYQGESNGRNPEPYYSLFPQLIKSWRNVWSKNNPQLTPLPFFYVQIAPYRNNVDGLTPEAWAYIRDAQLKTLALADTGMVVTTDLGEFEDIHPKAKQPVGERLALHGLAFAGKKCIASGPLYAGSRTQGNEVIITFTETGSGLTTGRVVMNRKRNLPVGQDPDAYVVEKDTLAGFTIAESNRKFVAADAKIVGNTVVVSSPTVKSPVAVRYGWSTFPLCNLYNKEQLPASPFRTDNYPVKDVQGRMVGTTFSGDTTTLGHAMQFTGSTGETAWEQVTQADRQGYQVTPGQGSGPSYAYYKITDQSLKSGKCPMVLVSMIYYDRGRGTVTLQYDSSDKNILVTKDSPGAWKNGGNLKLENTRTWKKADFTITDALFDGRCNGADIRLNCAKSFLFSKLYCRSNEVKGNELTVGETAFQEMLGRNCPVVRLWPDGTGPDAQARGKVADEQYFQEVTPPHKSFTKVPALKVTKVSEPSFTIISPEKNNSGTAIIFCPGGAYGSLVSHRTLECVPFFNDLGITVVWLKYRVPRLRDDSFIRGHHAIIDGQRALSLLRSRAAEWGIDPKKIGVHGSSAGGHLCAYLSLNHGKRLYEPLDKHDKVSCRPDFAILNFPAYLLQDNKSEAPRIDPAMHPENIKPEIVPPTIINLCMDDNIAAGSVPFYDALMKNKVPAELHVYPRGGHSGAMHKYPFNEWAMHTARFLADHGFVKAQTQKTIPFRIVRTDEIAARDGELPCDRVIRQMLGGKSESYAIWPDGKIPEDKDAPEKESYTYNNNYRLTDVAVPTITVMRPEVNKSGRAVIVCPGGGYNKLAVEHEGVEIGRWLNSQGITAILLKYRVPRRKDVAKHHVAFQDIQRAMRFVRSRADALKINPDKIGTIGFSAGGHLCASLSVNHMVQSYDAIDEVDGVDAKPNFTILVYPAYLSSGQKDGKLDPFFVQPFSSKNTSDTFICVAADDGHNVGIIDYYQHLRRAKIPTEMHFFYKGGHGGGLREKHPFPEWITSCQRWLKDLELTLTPKTGT